jgi:hypothetical protein
MADQGNYSVKDYFGGNNTQQYKDYQAGKSAGKYSDLMDYVGKTQGAKPIQYSGGGNTGGNFQSTVQNAIGMAQQAVQPAVQAVQAQAAPLKQRYDDLIASLKGNQQTAENRQTVTTNAELAKRGISNTSGLAQQELTQALQPITSEYTGRIAETGNQGNIALADLASQVAQLQSNAGLQGLSLGSNQYQFGQNLGLQQQQMAQQASAAKSADDWKRLLYETIQLPESRYTTGKPYYKDTTGDGAGDWE